MWKKLRNSSAGLLLLAAIPMSAYALDCSHKPPCPTGTTAQESVSCDACCAGESYIKKATDKHCCIAGYTPTDDGFCVPDGAILKSDGSCYVMAESDPCCKEGWHLVNRHNCCPDGFNLATDNESCCTNREDGKCCPPLYSFVRVDGCGYCYPPKPAGIQVR